MPIIVPLLLYYTISDPFMSIWEYDDYRPARGKSCNNDVICAIRLLDKYADSLHYNSFIIGSSRSDFYYVDDWRTHLSSTASCFHFNQSADNLYGSLQRIRYLYRRFDKIDNLLLIIDADYLDDMSAHSGHLFRIPPQVTRNPIDGLLLRWEELRAFYQLEFQKEWISGNIQNSFQGTTFNPYLNEIYKNSAEAKLQTMNLDEYNKTLSKDLQLYKRSGVDSINDVVILKNQEIALKEIALLARNGGTKLKVVVSPLYNQIQLNPSDVAILKKIFGDSNVYDFSGINEYTCDIKNYYENSHYRPILCRKLLDIVYQEK